MLINSLITEESRVMALSEINIGELVQFYTNGAISEANYHVLRQYLLERKPLLTVTTKINEFLSQHSTSDKQIFMSSVTQEACLAQINSDSQEVVSDEQEKASDSSLKSTYKSELRLLDTKLNQLDAKCFIQQKSFDQVRSQHSELKIQLDQVNSALDRVKQERFILNARYPFNINTGYRQNTVHIHSNGLQFPTFYPDSFVSFSLQDQFAWDRMYHEENRLVEECRGLRYKLDLKDSECTREEQNLNRFLQEKTQTERRYSDIKRQIDIDLPNKEQQRQLRSQERIVRENARKKDDPSLQQLSYNNREALQQKIANKNNELDRKQSNLMGKAEETSYTAYVAQLELALAQKDGPKITYYEREALNTILSLMNTYLKMEEREQQIAQSLHGEFSKLHLLKTQLEQNQIQLQKYVTSEPELVEANKKLTAENTQLNLDSDSAGNIRTNALYTSLFGICGSALSAGYLINTFVISPIFIAIPAGLALITLIALTVAVIYHFKQSASDGHIEKNTQIVSDNEATILQQLAKARDLSETTIPSLKAQIAQTEQSILLIEQQLKEQRNIMTQQLGKAQTVSSTNGGGNSFFGGTAPTEGSFYPSLPLKEAPQEMVIRQYEPITYGGQAFFGGTGDAAPTDRLYPVLPSAPPSYESTEGYTSYVPL